MAERPPRLAGRSGAGWSQVGAEGGAEGAADDHPFAVPQEARYEAGGELGAGGMGQVLSALDRRLQRQVALKRVAAAVRGQGGLEQRLAREAQITAALDHPAIVPVFDAGRDQDGALYYTMRLVRGRTLGEALADAPGLAGRLALLRHFLVACEAVAYAHSQGVVHRDLKPGNILVGEFGETQVADWGLARRLEEASDEAGTPGGAPGTPGYMSPEQAAGTPADARADVFSLGVVLRELLGGVSPGAEAGDAAGAPPELAAICARAAAPAPAHRYADARSLAADVARYLDGRRVDAHSYSLLDGLRRFARARRAPLSVGAVALGLLLGLGLWALRRTGLERDRALAAERQARAALAAADRSLGRALVEQAQAALERDAQPEAEVLAAAALELGESPEARGVLAAFSRARPRLLERTALPRCDELRLRPDGALLCVQGGAVALHAGRPLRERWRREVGAGDAAWLAPGRVVVSEAASLRGLLLAEDDGAELGRLPKLAAPRGFVEGGAIAALLNPARLSIIRPDRASPSADGAGPLPEASPCGGDDRHLAAATAGDTIAVACWDGAVVLLGADGRERRRLRTGRGVTRPGVSAVALTANGRALLLATLDGEVLALDAETGAERAHARLAAGVIRRIVPAPGGERVALLADRGGVTLWHAVTGAVLGRLPAGRDRAAAWAGDDELLVAGDELRRWSLPAALPAARILRPRAPGLAAVDLSPDGGRLALARGDGGLTVLDTTTGAQLQEHRLEAGVVKGARFLPGGGLLAWSLGPPSLRRYDRDGAPLGTWDLHGLRRAALLPGGWLVSVGYGHGAGLHDLRRPAAPRRVLGDGQFLDADQSEDGRSVALLAADGGLWLVRDGDPPAARRVLQRPGAGAVAVAGEALLAVAGERDGEIIEAATGRTRCRFVTGGRRILDLALSPDGRLLAAADQDRAARLWSTDDGRLLAVLRGHEERVSGVSFAAGLLATASWDGSARLWDLRGLERPAATLRAEVEAAWGLDREAAGYNR